ncbi:hypothetical protein V5799_012926 [Amblyomma americanum]|uniref:Carboxylesterase type B domain-containing protein n=1 Tax=Amblyomma americanum TaxID=6943 RepID=A0AAQ4E7G7_AMBAM
MSEDCLTLSIWAPVQCNKSSALYAVLVVLSSEWFRRGHVEEYASIWEGLSASGNLVVVFINHRLGMLGFLDPEVNDAPGNVGIHDAFLALTWISEHIRAFHGNPNFLVGLGDGSGSYIVSLDLFAAIWGRKRFFRRLILHGISPASLLPKVGSFSSISSSFKCDRDGDVASSVACLRDMPLSQIYESMEKQKPLLFMPSCDKPPIGHCGDVLSQLPMSPQHKEILCGYRSEDARKLFDHYMMQQAGRSHKEPSEAFDLLQRFFTGKPPRREFKELPLGLLQLLNQSNLQGFRELMVDVVLRCPLLRLVQEAVLKGIKVYLYALETRSVVFEPALTKEEIIDFVKTG